MKKQTFSNLVSLAQQESVPCVDIADRVMVSVSALTRSQRDPYRAYAWVSAVSAAIAACIIVAATLSWQTHSDSVSEIIDYVSWVAQ